MKRHFKLAASCLVVISCLAASALAASENTYHFADTSGDAHNEVTVSIPEGFFVLTRDVSPSDPGLKVLGADAQALKDFLVKNSIYIDAVTSDKNDEIVISMSSTESSRIVGNFSRFSSDEIMQYQDDTIKNYSSLGLTVDTYQTYKTGEQIFADIHASKQTENGGKMFSETYVSIINGYSISYVYNSNHTGQALTDSQKQILRHIVDTAEYSPNEAPVSVTAPQVSENTEYGLDELGIRVSIPRDMMTFTLNINQDDPNLKAIGYTPQQMLDLLNQNKTYLASFDKHLLYEYDIRKVELDVALGLKDFNQYSDNDLRQISGDFVSGFEKSGPRNTTIDVYDHLQTKFFQLDYTIPNDAKTMYAKAYITIAGGKLIGISVSCSGHSVGDNEASLLRQIVDSIRFNNLVTAPPSVAPSKTTAISNSVVDVAKASNPVAFTIGRIVGTLIFLGLLAGIIARIAFKARSKAERKPTTSIPFWSQDTPTPEPVPPQIPNPTTPETPAGVVICPTCGMKNQSDRVVCYRCGRALHGEPKAEDAAADEDLI